MREDPRVSVTTSALQAQFELARTIAERVDRAYDAAERVRPRAADLAKQLARANAQLAQLLNAVETGDGAPSALQRATFATRAHVLDALLRQAGAP